jgi:ferrous iron transport protein A
MGLVRGALIEVANIAPFGGPVEIKCKGYNLSLRKDELSRLELSPT